MWGSTVRVRGRSITCVSNADFFFDWVSYETHRCYPPFSLSLSLSLSLSDLLCCRLPPWRAYGCFSTTVNVYFNANGAFSYCDDFSCTVTGYMNPYVEGTTSLSLCQVEAGGAVIHDKIPFASSGHIPLTFNLPEVGGSRPFRTEFYCWLVLATVPLS